MWSIEPTFRRIVSPPSSGQKNPRAKNQLVLQLPAHAGSSLADFSTLKMEAIRSSEPSVQSTTSTRPHTSEDGILHSHRRENLKSYIIVYKLTRIFSCLFHVETGFPAEISLFSERRDPGQYRTAHMTSICQKNNYLRKRGLRSALKACGKLQHRNPVAVFHSVLQRRATSYYPCVSLPTDVRLMRVLNS
jgi:hypothetical protein